MNTIVCKLKVSEFIRREYGTKENGATPPSNQTIRRRCENGELPAERDGKLWYINYTAYKNMTGDNLVDSVLAKTKGK